jgi:hypothetical protein
VTWPNKLFGSLDNREITETRRKGAPSNGETSHEQRRPHPTTDPEQASDVELASRAARGDTRAFECIMRRHNQLVGIEATVATWSLWVAARVALLLFFFALQIVRLWADCASARVSAILT